jgi:hypothetical protein
VPAATDTKWLSPVLKNQVACFWAGRIKFLDVNYQPRLSARQAHCLVYWGENWQRFKKAFDEYGVVQVPISVLTVDQNSLTVSTTVECQPVEHTVLTVDQNSLTVSTAVEYQLVEHTVLTFKPTERTRRRSRGEGTGKIQWRTITKKNGKQYQQAWYDWQLHSEAGTIYRSTFIPKRLIFQALELEVDKTPIWEILSVLGVEL